MGQTISRVLLRRAVPAIVVGAVLYFLGRNLWGNWAKLREYPWQLNYAYLGLSFLLVGATFVFIVFIWLLILRKLGAQLSFKKGFRIWFLSALGKYLPGKVWQVFGLVYLCRREGVSVEESATSVILVHVLSIVPGIGVFFLTAGSLNPGFRGSFYGLLFLIPLGLVIAYPPILERLINFFARKLKREEVHFRARYTDVLGFMLLYLLSWLLYGCAFFSFVRAIAYVHYEHIFAFSGVFTGAYLLGLYSIFVPGGLGVREGALVFLLMPFFPLPIATALSLASRIWLTLAELICVGISLSSVQGSAFAMVRGKTGQHS